MSDDNTTLHQPARLHTPPADDKSEHQQQQQNSSKQQQQHDGDANEEHNQLISASDEKDVDSNNNSKPDTYLSRLQHALHNNPHYQLEKHWVVRYIVTMRHKPSVTNKNDFKSLLQRVLPHSVFKMLYRLYIRIRRLPITEFYIYMLRVDKNLFASTLFANYILPIIIETLPWYMSRRKLSKELRESRNSIQHRLLLGGKYDANSIISFVVLSVIYAILYTIEQTLRTRIMLANRLVVKRLVMERILYSEIGSLHSKYMELFGEEVRTDQLEQRVFSDISETLQLFNSTIPSILRGAYTFTLQSFELYGQRDVIDVLSIIRPSIVGLVNESIDYLREKYLIEQQTIAMQKNAMNMSRVVSNIVDGLSEIQVNNMQLYQLSRLDSVIHEEIDSKQGAISAINSVYRIIQNRNVIDFATEVYVVHLVMQRRGINHEQFRRIQNDIDYVTRLFNRIWNLCKDAYRILDTQQRVIALLNLPSFIQEAKVYNKYQHNKRYHPERNRNIDIRPLEFNKLTIKKLKFRYKENLPLALNIQENSTAVAQGDTTYDGTVTIERGKTYAIVGQNRSGKSTLVQLICKLYNVEEEDDMDIQFNDESFHRIPRTQLRTLVSYIAQRPFIFPGTIEENIRIGNTEASNEDVERAAESAGVFLAEKPKPLALDDAQKQQLLMGGADNGGDAPIKPWQQSRLRDILLAAGKHLYNVAQKIKDPYSDNPYADQRTTEDINKYTILPSLISDDVLWNGEKKSSADATTDSQLPADEASKEAEEDSLASELPVNVNAIHPVLCMETAERGANLSGGFAQSVALARIFLRRSAEIVILDESMGQMDAIKKREYIIPRLFQFVRENNMTLIIISHDIATVSRLVDEIYVMEKGRVVQHGSHQQLVERKAEPYMRLSGLT